jgi:hypothetical protein
MRKSLALLAALAFAACAKDNTYESAGTTDTTGDTTYRVVVPQIDAGMKTDTLTVPVIETTKDTIIVDRPVGVGTKKVEVKRPTVDVKKP